MSNMLENEPFGDYISKLRMSMGYSQRKLALVTGLSNTTIARIENGEVTKPEAVTLRSLALHLGVDEDEMFKAAGYIGEAAFTLTKRDLKQIERELEKMKEDIKTNPNVGFAAYDGELDDYDIKLLENAFENALLIVKKINKEKYTPKKFK